MLQKNSEASHGVWMYGWLSKAYAAFAAEAPVDAGRGGDAANFLPEMLFQCRPPRHQLKPQAVIDHGEPSSSERDALAVDAGDGLPVHERLMRQPMFGGKLGRRLVEFAAAKRGKEIARKKSPAVPAGAPDPSSTR